MKPETLAKILTTLETAAKQSENLRKACSIQANKDYFEGKAVGLESAITEIRIAVAEEN